MAVILFGFEIVMVPIAPFFSAMMLPTMVFFSMLGSAT
jgi:hypothetical protein